VSTNCVKVYKYRIYPTKAQARQLDETLETCRQVYNSFLHWRTFSYDTERKSVGRYEQEAALTHWKKDHPELSEVHAHLLQNVAHRVDLAFRAFSRRAKAGETPGYPRRKGMGQYDSFCFKQWGNGVQFKSGNLWLSRIGEIKCQVHRPMIGSAKTCCLHRVNGKWFACITCEVERECVPPSEESIGIDVGIKAFAALSDGTFIENPKFFRTEEAALAKSQRKFVKQKRGSRERKRARKVVARVHERVRNRRHNFTHQTARRLVNQYGLIAVEKLAVKNMSKSPKPKQDSETGEYLPNGASLLAGLNKSILDAAWSQFRMILTSKAESACREVVAVRPAFTSQKCSGCGYTAPKTLKERWHLCPMCGTSLDRDVNAAVNILQIALG
jgi:putative transposase